MRGLLSNYHVYNFFLYFTYAFYNSILLFRFSVFYLCVALICPVAIWWMFQQLKIAVSSCKYIFFLRCCFYFPWQSSACREPLSLFSAVLVPYKVSKLTVIEHKYAGTLPTTGGTAYIVKLLFWQILVLREVPTWCSLAHIFG